MKIKRILCEIIAFVLFVALLITSVCFFTKAYTPERESYGATWNLFRHEKENSLNVMFFGSSMVYCDIVPARIYENTGLTSYALTGPEMTIPQTYFYIKEALNTQSPQVVFVELSPMYFPDHSEGHANETVGLMPYSKNRIDAIFETTDADSRFSLLFPLNKYHDRWQTVNLGKQRADDRLDDYAGYTPLIGVLETLTEKREWVFDNTNVKFDKNVEYLGKISQLCKENNIELVYFMAPALSNYSQENMEKIRGAVGDETFLDFNQPELYDSLSLDMQTDFYDPLHLNLPGALKFSDHLSDYIVKNFDPDKLSHDKTLWQTRIDKINELLNM